MIKTSVKRPVGVIMIVVAIIALGAVSLRGLVIDLFPEIDLPVAVVATSYEDAAPEDVENLISRPLEGAVRSEEHTSELQSRGHLVCRLLLEKKKKHKDASVRR